MGLGAETLAADEALGQSWFFAYNLLAGVLALAGAVAAVLLALQADDRWLFRVLRRAAWAAGIVLLLRGAVGILALAFQLITGSMDSPFVLVVIEPWFVVGGMLFGALAAKSGHSREQS